MLFVMIVSYLDLFQPNYALERLHKLRPNQRISTPKLHVHVCSGESRLRSWQHLITLQDDSVFLGWHWQHASFLCIGETVDVIRQKFPGNKFTSHIESV